jgi:hypothetical protein
VRREAVTRRKLVIKSNNRLKRSLGCGRKLTAAADEPSEAAEQVDAAEDKGQPVVRICVIMHVDEVDSPILQRGSANVSAARNISAVEANLVRGLGMQECAYLSPRDPQAPLLNKISKLVYSFSDRLVECIKVLQRRFDLVGEDYSDQNAGFPLVHEVSLHNPEASAAGAEPSLRSRGTPRLHPVREVSFNIVHCLRRELDLP